MTLELAKSTCYKCSGTGKIRAFAHVYGGDCFACRAQGFRYVSPKAVEAYRARLPRKVATDLVVGDRIRTTHLEADGGGWKVWADVVEVIGLRNSGASTINPDGSLTPHQEFAVVVESKRGRQEKSFLVTETIQLSFNSEDVQRILAELAPRFRKGIVQVAEEAVAS